MKQRDITGVQDCAYKIKALLKEYNCRFHVDEAMDLPLIVADCDTLKFEVLPCVSDQSTGEQVRR